MKVEWIEHEGVKILFANYKDVKSQDEMFSILEEIRVVLEGTTEKVLWLIDATNAAIGPDYMKASKEQGKKYADKVEKSAMIGVAGLKSMLLKGYNSTSGNSVKPCDSREEALAYLLS